MEATITAPHVAQVAPTAQQHDEVTPHSQCLRIALGSEAYALSVDYVREILEVVQMTPLPLMPSFVRGVMNLRGAVVPVIDLGARLGLDVTSLGKRSCVVIVDVAVPDDGGRQTLGVLVDAVYEVFDVTNENTEAVPRLGMRVDAHHVRSILRVRGQATPELNLDTVLDQAELARLIGAHAARS